MSVHGYSKHDLLTPSFFPGNDIAFPSSPVTLTFPEGSSDLQCIPNLMVPIDNLFSSPTNVNEVFLVTTTFLGETSEQMAVGQLRITDASGE